MGSASLTPVICAVLSGHHFGTASRLWWHLGVRLRLPCLGTGRDQLSACAAPRDDGPRGLGTRWVAEDQSRAAKALVLQ